MEIEILGGVCFGILVIVALRARRPRVSPRRRVDWKDAGYNDEAARWELHQRRRRNEEKYD